MRGSKPCPPGCTCGKHNRRNPVVVKKCPPGCTCGKHHHHVPQEVREKISKGHIKRMQELGEMPSLPDRKKCKQCGQWKDVPDDFYIKKSKIKSGLVREYADSLCKTCRQKRNKIWVKRQGAKKMKKRRQRYVKNWARKLGKPEVRRRENEKRAFKRDQEGRLRGKFKTKPAPDPRVNKTPVFDYVSAIKEEKELSNFDIATPEFSERQVTRFFEEGRSGQITLATVDHLLRGVDEEDQLTMLYPDA